MSDAFEFNSLLVPVDFTPASQLAFHRALQLADGDSPVVILLHVIDPALVSFAEAHQWGTGSEIAAAMKARAQQQLDTLRSEAPDGIEVDALVSEGVPFLEILTKAEQFAVDAILIGKVGTRGGVEKLLFGSTAEKVLRGSRRPVLVLPHNE